MLGNAIIMWPSPPRLMFQKHLKCCLQNSPIDLPIDTHNPDIIPSGWLGSKHQLAKTRTHNDYRCFRCFLDDNVYPRWGGESGKESGEGGGGRRSWGLELTRSSLAQSHAFKSRRPPPFSMPLCSKRSMGWCPWLCAWRYRVYQRVRHLCANAGLHILSKTLTSEKAQVHTRFRQVSGQLTATTKKKRPNNSGTVSAKIPKGL